MQRQNSFLKLKDMKNLSLFKSIKLFGTSILLISILSIALWIRIQGTGRIPEGQFTSTDAYLYHFRAQTIAEQGKLPSRDMHRWLPVGRDNEQTLLLYPYALAYTYQFIHYFFPNVTLYVVQLYAPIICFIVGLVLLLLFLIRFYGVSFAVIVGLLLSTLPGSIERSAAGFGDRDAWCLMFGIFAVVSYLWKEQQEPGWRRTVWTLLAGFSVLLGCFSWEAFGIFVLILLSVELFKFCTSETEQHLKEFFSWILMFVPLLYVMSPAYRSGYGFSKHLFALTIAPPLVLLAMQGARYILLQQFEVLRIHARKLSLGLTFICIVIGLGYILFQSDTFTTTAFAFQESRLMKTVSELSDPTSYIWLRRYGIVYGIGSLGLMLGSIELGTPKVISLRTTLFLFFLTTFARDLLNDLVGTTTCNLLFGTSIVLSVFALSMILRQYSARELTGKKQILLITIVWYIVWVSFARSGVRYDFFVSIPLAFGTAWLFCCYLPNHIEELKDLKILNANIEKRIAAVSVTIIVLGAMLFLPGNAGYMKRSVYAATHMRRAIPGDGSLAQALAWINSSLSANSIMAAYWGYGGQLNVIGNVKTIIDHDHYIPHWIHLYNRYVFCAKNEQEALEYLKTHDVTHLMMTEWRLTSYAGNNSFIGSNEENDRHFELHELVSDNPSIDARNRLKPKRNSTPLVFADIIQKSSTTITVSAHFRDRTTVQVHANISSPQTSIDLGNSGIVLFIDSQQRLNRAYYIPPIGWNSLAVKLFFRGETSLAFKPIYPIHKNQPAKVKIWKILYPSNIQKKQKYMETELDPIR